jgi:hypothetical protein
LALRESVTIGAEFEHLNALFVVRRILLGNSQVICRIEESWNSSTIEGTERVFPLQEVATAINEYNDE